VWLDRKSNKIVCENTRTTPFTKIIKKCCRIPVLHQYQLIAYTPSILLILIGFQFWFKLNVKLNQRKCEVKGMVTFYMTIIYLYQSAPVNKIRAITLQVIEVP
jgi:hypothetical protein